jgi:hypothetical protein
VSNYQGNAPPLVSLGEAMLRSFTRLEQRVVDLEEIVNYINIKPPRFHHKRLPLPGEPPIMANTTDDKWDAQEAGYITLKIPISLQSDQTTMGICHVEAHYESADQQGVLRVV